MASYNVVTIDLSTVQERVEVSPENRAVDAVAVLSLTVGGEPLLFLGAGPGIPVYAGFAVDICPEELGGIFLANPAAVAGSIVLLVSHGGVRPVGGA